MLEKECAVDMILCPFCGYKNEDVNLIAQKDFALNSFSGTTTYNYSVSALCGNCGFKYTREANENFFNKQLDKYEKMAIQERQEGCKKGIVECVKSFFNRRKNETGK
jgi:hypothetical protein